MRIATWNVNSIRAREERLVAWLTKHSPDVLCLQELKVEDAKYPKERLEALGYTSVVHGQKTYNGVAILTKAPATEVITGLGDDVADPQSRLVSAKINGVRIVSVYMPNGQAVGSEKWIYKLAWMKRFHGWLGRHTKPTEALAVCGDFNVAPEPIDVHDPAAWEGETIYHPDARAGLAEIRSFGLVDTFRKVNPDAALYSWWDYRMLGFPKNRGLRIDHIDATAPLAQKCIGSTIDRDERKGEAPSDHAPVISTFEI